MWQVSGRSDITDFEEVVRLDKEYITNRVHVVFHVCNSLRNNPDKILLDFVIFVLINNDLFVVYVVVLIDQDNLSVIKSRLGTHGALSAVEHERVLVVDVGTEGNADVVIVVSVYQEATVRPSQFVHQLRVACFWIVIHKILC